MVNIGALLWLLSENVKGNFGQYSLWNWREVQQDF